MCTKNRNNSSELTGYRDLFGEPALAQQEENECRFDRQFSSWKTVADSLADNTARHAAALAFLESMRENRPRRGGSR